MSEPEQYTPHDSSAAQQAAPVSPNPSGSEVPQPNQEPEYGQYLNTQYGAMESQFPSNYDPYLFGRPDPTPEPANQQNMQNAQQAQQSIFGQIPMTDSRQHNAPQQQYYGQNPQNANSPNQQTNNRYPRYVNGVDLEDPNQNPMYHHWDFGAILALVFAIIFPVPILPAIMGALSMRRTRLFRMRGYGLAVAAVIINVLYSIVFFWLMINGVNINDVANQMLDNLNNALQQQNSSGINA